MAQPDNRLQFTVEDARLAFRNFSGKEGPYNREGDRNFLVILDEASATRMANDGWNVKRFKPQEDGDEPNPYIQVTVGYKVRPPRVVMITSSGRTNLDESTIGALDFVNIRTVDLIAVASHWEVNGKTGIKAYLKTMFVTVEEDELERKYAINEDANVG